MTRVHFVEAFISVAFLVLAVSGRLGRLLAWSTLAQATRPLQVQCPRL